jgi:hypothetical protein
MLVVTTNWCLSDGSLAAAASLRAVGAFRHEVRRAALRHGFRRDGVYAPVAGIDVVFAGDTFDWLTSRVWAGDQRPWHIGPRADAMRRRVAVASARRGGRLLATLATWSRRGMEVPNADRHGRPTLATTARVPVRVALLRGDRDRWLEHVPGDGTQQEASIALGTCWSDGRATVLHGDGLDPLCATADSEPTLGESLAVDLVVRFVTALETLPAMRRVAPAIAARVARGRSVDAAGRLAAWLESAERRSLIGGDTRRAVVDLWKRSVGAWHRAARRLALGGHTAVDPAATVAAWLEIGGFSAKSPTFEPPKWSFDATTPPLVEPASLVVLGHEVPGAQRTAEGRSVCLGDRPLQSRSEVGDDREWPATAVLATEGPERRIDWLLAGDGERGQRGGPDDEPGGVVWVSSPAGAGGIFVDAA